MLTETTKAHQKLQKEYESCEKERSRMELSIDQYRENLEKTESVKKKLQHEVSWYIFVLQASGLVLISSPDFHIWHLLCLSKDEMSCGSSSVFHAFH